MGLDVKSMTANVLYYALVIVVIGGILFLISYTIKNKEAFTENPLVFGAEKMKLGECNCQCYNDIDREPISLYFNQTSVLYSPSYEGTSIKP